MRLQFIYSHRDHWPIAVSCYVLEVSRAAYYKWMRRTPALGAERRKQIVAEIKAIHATPRQEDYGSPRVHRELLRRGVECCVNTVARLMQQSGIRARRNRRYRVCTTTSNHAHPVAPNLIERNFSADRPNEIWLSDFTYIPIDDHFCYLCTIQDLFSRRIVGWATSETIDTELALTALNQAIAFRSPPPGLVFHSDRGSQYASRRFRKRIGDCGFQQSMSRKGNCYDNAPMESFFKTFKVEEVYRNKYETREQVTRAVSDYIDRFYNRKRLHSAIDFCSPIEFEERLRV